MGLPATDHRLLPRGVFAHPALQPLVKSVSITPGGAAPLGVEISPDGQVRVGGSLGQRAGALVLARFALELAWLRRLPDLSAAAATLLAGRAAGVFLSLLPRAEHAASLEDPGVALLARLGEALPPIAQLTACWRLLAEAMDSDEAAPDLRALELVGLLWKLVAPTEALLVQGGDDRLTLDPETARNRYLCTPWPQPEAVCLGSCTASSIAPDAFEAAEAVRQDLVAAALGASEESVLATASDQIVGELLVHFGVEDLADCVLAASGTDATLLLTGLLAAERPRQALTTVLMSPAETGSGVPEAVQGRHFAACTAAGIAVEKGGAVDGFPPGLSLVSVPLRTPDGAPRPEEEIAAQCEALIEAAAKRGHVVLHAIDGSKTGMAAPSLLACDLLAERFAGKLDIVVDACQVRIEPARVRAYLERGWPVLITGSKFFAAPGFCGAVLFPRARLKRIAGAGRLPDGLHAYASLSDGTVSRRCPGLLLRWSAALTHMRRFAVVPEGAVRAALDKAGATARAALMRAPGVRLVPAPRPQDGVWSSRPSVLTFTVEGYPNADALRPLYRALAEGPRPVLIGQPVQLGSPAVGGLRVAFSAAQIAGGGDIRDEMETVVERLTAAAG